MLYSELGVILTLALAGAALAALCGHPSWWLLLTCVGYSGWHLYQAVRLLRWLVKVGQPDGALALPHSYGLWGTVFALLGRRQRSFRAHGERTHAGVSKARDIAAAFSDAIVMLDAHSNITWCNPAAQDLLGVSYNEHRGRSLAALLDDSAFSRYLLRGEFHDPLSVRLARQPAVCLTIQIIALASGERLLTARDITTFSRLESMRVDFVANVSHELRTPLTVINGYLETLSSLDKACVPSSMLDRALVPMLAQCSRMEALVNDLTTLSRLESQADARDSGQVIVVAKLVERLLTEAPRTPDKAITVTIEPAALLLGQEKEIHSAFGNLINNACKYTRADGHVFVTWRMDAGRAVFEVRDDGDGIEAEHLPHLTERFYRVDKSRSVSTGGTGLGLAIVKHALMRHQAALEIDSEPGQGSCFRCVFPLHRIQLR